MSAFSGVLPLLPRPTPGITRTRGVHRRDSTAGQGEKGSLIGSFQRVSNRGAARTWRLSENSDKGIGAVLLNHCVARHTLRRQQCLALHYRSVRLNERLAMLLTIAVILVILWALGLVSSFTMGGLIHILLVVALIVILVNFIGGRRSL